MDREIINREYRLLIQTMLTRKGIILLFLAAWMLVGSFFWDSVAQILRLYYFLAMVMVLRLPVQKILYYLPMEEDGIFKEIKIRTFLQFFIIMLIHIAISSLVILGKGLDFGVYFFNMFYFESAMLVFLITNSMLPAFYMRYIKICKKKEILMMFVTFMLIMIQSSISTAEEAYKEGYVFFLRNPIFLVLTVCMYVLLVYSVVVSFKWLKKLCRNYETVEEKKRK